MSVRNIKIDIAIATLIVLALLAFRVDHPLKSVLKPGIYQYKYISILSLSGDADKGNWKNPRMIEKSIKILYRVINDSLIYKENNDTKRDFLYVDTLKSVPKQLLNQFKPVPENMIDYKLVGVFFSSKLPHDTYRVLYYSKKRESIFDQLHIFEPNRISGAVIYFTNANKNPFYEYRQYFELCDPVYTAPIQRIKLKPVQ